MFKQNNNAVDLYIGDKKVISDLVLKVNLRDDFEFKPLPEITPEITSFAENQVDYAFGENLKVTLAAKSLNGTVALYVDAKMEPNVINGPKSFNGYEGIKLEFSDLKGMTGFTSSSPSTSWWCFPAFGKEISEIPEKTISLLTKNDEDFVFYFPVTTNITKTEFNKNTIGLNAYSEGYTKIKGAFLLINVNKEPFEATKNLFEDATKLEVINIPLRGEREYPEMFKYFGWCSWNAFYHDVSSKGINEKLQEFKDKQIPLKWVIIDDGWSQYKDDKLTSFKEDRQKFPEGLKKFIKNAKKAYGVKYIAVWHAFIGYWLGIHPEGELYKEEKDNLIHLKTDYIVPDFRDVNKAYAFWNKWHTYLKKQGIDFLKIDVQGSLKNVAGADISGVLATKNMALAVDKSIAKNFNKNVINCMGVTQENILSRPITGMTRNSDDFFPNVENSFGHHLIQNAYNSIFHNALYHLDWDMWWSYQGADSVKSAVLRAISGGPVYISDEVGATLPDLIMPIIEDDGRILMCDRSALPSEDCLFEDVSKTNKLIKLNNTVKDCGVLALFNVSQNKEPSHAKVKLSDIYGIDQTKDYVAYSYFEKKYYYLAQDTELDFTIDFDKVEILNFYPVNNGFIDLGDTEKFVSSASSVKVRTDIKTLIGE